ncbi:MAG: hypothetical protein MJZ76_05300 [Bacteroidales bacterium]|nr:hypothetical protein [Bacteroidales bacterium]
MRTTHQVERKPKPEKERKGTLSDLFDGEIFFSPTAMKLYPIMGLILLFCGLLIYNQNKLDEKRKKINALENEYNEELSNLKKNNQFIPYEESQELLQIIEEKGFKKNESSRYKIVIKPEQK